MLSDGHSRKKDEAAADEEELYEQIGRLKMEVEWLWDWARDSTFGESTEPDGLCHDTGKFLSVKIPISKPTVNLWHSGRRITGRLSWWPLRLASSE